MWGNSFFVYCLQKEKTSGKIGGFRFRVQSFVVKY